MTEKRLKVGILFGGRSGEHEISLLSARSILSVMDPDAYDVVQIGITHDGSWLVGEDILDKFSTERKLESLNTSFIFPDPGRQGLYVIHATDKDEIIKQLSRLDVVFPILHGTYGEDGTVQGLLELAEIAYVGAGVLGSSVGMDKGV